MALGVKLIPLDGINLDVANAYLKPTQARFIKNLYYQLTDNAEAVTPENSETGKLKPLQSNEVYCPITLPAGTNVVIGTCPCRELAELYVFVYNSNSNHVIFRINGDFQTADVSAPNPCYNFKLSPEHFIGEGQCYIDVNTFVDADSGLEVTKKDVYWTDGFNYQGFVRFDDYLLTNGYDPVLFPYFAGNYDKCPWVRVGLPTPKDCVTYTQVANTEADAGLNNTLLFQGTQIRITAIDVFGRPSEHGIISDLYLPGVNDCFSASSELPRCLDLSILIGNPLIDKIAIEFSNNNELQWYTDSVINLYEGSALGQWWTRSRNPDANYDPTTDRITYRYCRNKECNPIDPAETNKLEPSLSKRAQAMGKVGQRLGFANNKYKFNPFPKNLLDKFSLKITPPTGDEQLRNISIYICVVSGRGCYFNGNQFWWGTSNQAEAEAVLQTFPEGQKSWVGYLDDGSYAYGEQYYWDSTLDRLEKDVNNSHTFGGAGVKPGAFILQKFSFPAKNIGSYVFRLADHQTNPTLNQDYRDTSTTVRSLAPFNPVTVQPYLTPEDYSIRELLINTCDGDYDTFTDGKILVIQSLANSGSSNRTFSTKGYVYEDVAKDIPVELIKLENGSNVATSLWTDYNGFYWFTGFGISSDVTFDVRYKCTNTNFQIPTGSDINAIVVRDIILDPIVNTIDFSLFPCDRQLIKGRVVLKDGLIGIPNINVTLTRSRTVTTDANGYFTIVAHDQYGQSLRQDKLVFGSPCGYTDENCECISPIDFAFQQCSICIPIPESPPASPPDPNNGERVITIVNDFVFCYLKQQGLLSGGTYGWGATGYDWLGRKTYIQNFGYFTLPSIPQNKTIGASTVDVIIDPTAVFPPEIEYIVFSITEETTMDDYLDWIVDNVVFIDNTGEENNQSPTQIKIYYKSIIEYNKQNGYNTTDGWQFFAQTVDGTITNTPRIADKVQFFINGDGTFFTKSLISLIKYDSNGEYFLIDYTTDLQGLTANAYMRLIRPKVCTGNESYYEICSSKQDIIDHKATVTSFRLNAFDTYYLNRQIPVPTLVPPVPPATEPTFINELRIPGRRFEHHSPSNFWGYKIWNRGRLNVKNPYESEILRPNEIQLGGVLSPTGQLSYLQNFDENFKHNFDINDPTGITYFRVKSGIIAFITQYNNFIVGYNDNLARLIGGNLQVPSGESTFGNPERRTNGDYGCTLFDKNTIREREGLIHFLDTNRVAVLQHNFSDCTDVSTNNKSGSSILSWLIKKIKFIQEYNRVNEFKKYFHSVINPANFEWILTDFTINSENYVNKERDYNVKVHESFSFDIYNRTWKEMYDCVPEYYGYIEGEKNGQQLFSFKNAVPYYHYGTNGFGVIFGQEIERIYEFIITAEIMKKQKPGWLEVYCKDSGYYCDRIITESGQQSRILKAYFKQGEFMYAAPFLRAINTPLDPNLPKMTLATTILEGNPLYGEWIQVRMVGYPESNQKYSQLSGIQVYTNGENNTGLNQP